MARTGLILFAILSFASAQMMEREEFESGILMSITEKTAVINEATYILDKNVKITDQAGNKIPESLIKLPAECMYQTNIMAGQITDQVKIVKIIILKPVSMETYGKKPEKTE